MNACTHARTGVVTSHPVTGSYQPGSSHAATNVCDRPECIAEAIAWVERMTRKPAHHVLDADRKTGAPA
jgi:hypothetical protein